MKKSLVCLVLGAILLSSCGKNHPYKKQKPIALFGPIRIGSGGYTDRALKDNHYFVRYCDAVGHQQAMHLAMIRAAEITINTGHKYFSIDDFRSSLQEPNVTDKEMFNGGKVVEDHSHLTSVLKKEYKLKNYGDSGFSIKDWSSLSWDVNPENYYPPTISMDIGVHNENPGYFVYDAEKVYRDLMPRYDEPKNQKSTPNRRINYSIYQIDEETALVATAASHKKQLGMAIELNVLAAAEYALSKGFQTIKLITSNTDHFKLTEYYSDFENKNMKDYDEAFNNQKGYMSYLVVKMSKEKGNGLLDCPKLQSHITAKYKKMTEIELERAKKEKEAAKNTYIHSSQKK